MKKLALVLAMMMVLALCGCVKQVPPEVDPQAVYEETYRGTVEEVFTEGSGADTAQVLKVQTDSGETVHFTVTEETAFLWLDEVSGAGGETTLEKIAQEDCVEVHCQSFQDSDYYPAITVTALPIRNDFSTPIAVYIGGEVVEPYVHLGSSTTWDGKYWLCADGLSLENRFPGIAGEIPSFTYSDDYELLVGENVTLSGPATFNVYSTDFELSRLYLPADDLTNLPEGSHYLVLGVQERGDYIASEEAYEEFWYQCAYLVHK